MSRLRGPVRKGLPGVTDVPSASLWKQNPSEVHSDWQLVDGVTEADRINGTARPERDDVITAVHREATELLKNS